MYIYIYIYEEVFVRTNRILFGELISKRNALKIPAIPHRTALLDKNFFGMVSRIFNKIPIDILKTPELPNFKNKLQKFLITKTYYNINDFLNDNTN